MIRDKINRRDTFLLQIFNGHIQQAPCDPLAAIAFLRIDRADIGSQVLSVMEIIFDDAQSPCYMVTVQTEIPMSFR
jgi:hypothetical protein